jgi:polyisoprenoid-binding protein YceI
MEDTMSAWNIDTTHSGIHFTVRHMVVAKVRGRFTKFSGAIQLDDADFTKSSVSIDIDAASIDTGVADRDNHLRSPDFFDVANAPSLTFASKRIEKSGSNFSIIGDLTIRGVTKEVTLHAEDEGRGKDPWGNDRAMFSAKTQIDRKDFGLGWNQVLEAGGVLVGTQINIELEIQAVKQK